MLLSQVEERDLGALSREQKTAIVYGGWEEYGGTGDLTLVLGGQPRECEARARKAAELYRAGRTRFIMPTGGVRWDTDFGNLSEAQLLAEYLRREGVPESAVCLEEMAENTKENMLFCGVQIIRQLRTEPIRKILLVTSCFHMRRSLTVAKCFLPRQYEVFPCGAPTEADDAEHWDTLEYRAKRVRIELINLRRDILRGVGPDIAF